MQPLIRCETVRLRVSGPMSLDQGPGRSSRSPTAWLHDLARRRDMAPLWDAASLRRKQPSPRRREWGGLSQSLAPLGSLPCDAARCHQPGCWSRPIWVPARRLSSYSFQCFGSNIESVERGGDDSGGRGLRTSRRRGAGRPSSAPFRDSPSKQRRLDADREKPQIG